MENAEEIFHFLEDFSKRKPKTIPQELNEYLAYVARTGDPVYQWCHVKSLFKEKLLSVITDFYETTPGIDIPPYPNVDPFNYDIMKNHLIERLDSFTAAPFTVQRICELLTYPRKQYNRVDKFMRAIEKNILVVSTREPGIQRHSESENGEANEPIVNGSDNNSEYNVDVEMEDMSWKDNQDKQQSEPQPGSSDTQPVDDIKKMMILNDDIEARLKAKQESSTMDQDKTVTQYESVTPPELNVTSDDSPDPKPCDSPTHESEPKPATEIEEKPQPPLETQPTPESTESKTDIEMKTEPTTLIIPEIKVDDAEMTEQKLLEQANALKETKPPEVEAPSTEEKPEPAPEPETPQVIDESSSDSKDETESKHVISEVSTSSEESSSSSDNTDGNSNSPKTDESQVETHEPEPVISEALEEKHVEVPVTVNELKKEEIKTVEDETALETPKIETENYSISDVSSELTQPQIKDDAETLPKPVEEVITDTPKESVEETTKDGDNKAETPESSTDTKDPEST